jgi:hypothetical protein
MRTRRCEACGSSRNDRDDICCRDCGAALPAGGDPAVAGDGGFGDAALGSVFAERPGNVTWARVGVMLTAVATVALVVLAALLAVRGRVAGR